jgi:hypothetical protein
VAGDRSPAWPAFTGTLHTVTTGRSGDLGTDTDGEMRMALGRQWWDPGGPRLRRAARFALPVLGQEPTEGTRWRNGPQGWPARLTGGPRGAARGRRLPAAHVPAGVPWARPRLAQAGSPGASHGPHANQSRKQMVMILSTVPRNIARLEYSAVRLPLTLLEEHVVARYWDDDAVLRLGFERFLGSLDEIAGRLLADDDLARRGLALMLRPEYQAMSDERAGRAQARRLQAEAELAAEAELPAEQATARRPRERATAKRDAEVAATVRPARDQKPQPGRTVDGQARAKNARAERAARKRPAQAGKAPAASPARRRPSGRATGS